MGTQMSVTDENEFNSSVNDSCGSINYDEFNINKYSISKPSPY